MTLHSSLRRRLLACRLAAVVALAFAGPLDAQETKAGDIVINHPFAAPTLPGATVGAAYVGTLRNTGAKPDKLLRVATPVATSVEIHDMNVDTQGVMRMREIDGIAIAPKQSIGMRPGMGMHLMLMGLRAPLKAGDSFPMTLQFERGGKVDVKVVVEKPAG